MDGSYFHEMVIWVILGDIYVRKDQLVQRMYSYPIPWWDTFCVILFSIFYHLSTFDFFSIISSNRIVDKRHTNLMGFENSQVCLLIQNEIPARANIVSWLLCRNRSIYKLPPSFIKYPTIWWERLLLCKEAVLSSMLSVYSITDQRNIYFCFCFLCALHVYIILVYYMKLTNVITKLGKMGRAVPASSFFYDSMDHLIKTAMCLWQVLVWEKTAVYWKFAPLSY